MNKINNKFHYVYEIIELNSDMRYIGSRTSKIHPTLDIGIKYFSSSRNKEFILNQKNNPSNYKYVVLDIFEDKKSAIDEEIRLHNLYDVGKNKKYYNRSKQTSNKYDTTGKLVVKNSNGEMLLCGIDDELVLNGTYVSIHKGNSVAKINGKYQCIKTSEFDRNIHEGVQRNKMSVIDINGNTFCTDINDDRMNISIFGVTKNHTTVYNKITDDYEYINKSDFNQEIHLHLNENKVAVKDVLGNNIQVHINDPRFKSGELVGVTKDLMLIRDLHYPNNKCFYINKNEYETYDKSRYVNAQCGTVTMFNSKTKHKIVINKYTSEYNDYINNGYKNLTDKRINFIKLENVKINKLLFYKNKINHDTIKSFVLKHLIMDKKVRRQYHPSFKSMNTFWFYHKDKLNYMIKYYGNLCINKNNYNEMLYRIINDIIVYNSNYVYHGFKHGYKQKKV